MFMVAETPAQREAARNTSVVHLQSPLVSMSGAPQDEKKKVWGKERRRRRDYDNVRVDQEGSAAAMQASFRVEHLFNCRIPKTSRKWVGVLLFFRAK
jgi:hypothetical protein